MAGRSKAVGRLSVNWSRRSGHYQARHHSEVYRDGKLHVYTCWDDNDEERGQEADFGAWVRSHQGRARSA